MIINDIFTHFKNNDLDIQYSFNILLKEYYYFDIQLGYYSYLDYLEQNNLSLLFLYKFSGFSLFLSL